MTVTKFDAQTVRYMLDFIHDRTYSTFRSVTEKPRYQIDLDQGG